MNSNITKALICLDQVLLEIESGFVACSRCGDQEETKDLDFVDDIKAAKTELENFVRITESECENMSDKSNDKVVMPRALTAENGAKHLFIGEFKEKLYQECGRCDDGNISFDDEVFEACEFCEGQGSQIIDVQIEWSTIKQIYELAVKKLGEDI